MNDDLLRHYERELAYLRKSGAEFARTHPKVAGRLRIGEDAVEDPHVSRLVESVALLNARVRQKLDDEYPELTQSLLNVLYPHYLAPIPSMAIVQMVPKPDLTTGYAVPSGTLLETAPVGGEPCRFRTCFPVTLWPLRIEAVKLSGRPLLAPVVPDFEEASAALRIALRCAAPDVRFASLGATSLRFYLRGDYQFATRLYELLLNDTLGVALGSGADDARPLVLDAASVRPAGFAPEEAMLPTPPTAFPGYRLLTEYFTFPQKFLFFEIADIDPAALQHTGDGVELFVYVGRSSAELERDVGVESLALGCTPVVNLYEHRAEPIEVNHTRHEVQVVPDARRTTTTEVYSVDRVAAVLPDGDTQAFMPFYSVRHAVAQQPARRFWNASRRPARTPDGRGIPGTDVFVTLVDLDMNPSMPDDTVLEVQTTCLNRDLPGQLPFGGGQPRMQMAASGAPLDAIHCLTQPTATLRPGFDGAAQWRLVSHLLLNHLSLFDGEDSGRALREILTLYDFRDSAQTRATINGLLRVSCREAVARAPAARHGSICRGTEVTLELDPRAFAGSEMFLFASVLERFLALYTSINSFTRTVAVVHGREGVLRRWPPRAGTKPLI